jgi:hypothetical protein
MYVDEKTMEDRAMRTHAFTVNLVLQVEAVLRWSGRPDRIIPRNMSKVTLGNPSQSFTRTKLKRPHLLQTPTLYIFSVVE